ncbi:MAG: Eco57I restriction-modification methylase domain-containing protein, partial [Planctomycetaceae bacterium]|jgi:hypothetical protein|nr:Eco57I restriction-modification methylase domain-containing protein [Planctomycetaceae bacterium]
LAIAMESNGTVTHDTTKKMAEWNPFDSVQSTPFFDSMWMFGIENFDIVIGNPPYVEAKKLKKTAVHLKHYDVNSGTADLSVYFLERGLDLLKSGGLLMLIMTNKFFNTEYGKLVRKKIIKHQIRSMIDFEQVRVFESTLVSCVIIGIENCAPYRDEFRYQKFYKLNNSEFKALFAKKHTMGSYKQSLLGTNEWSFSDDARRALKNKIEKAGKKLSKLSGVAVYRGVTTGYNPAFIIDENKKNELIAADPNNAKIIKPILQGRNIKKWIYKYDDNHLIFTKQGLDIKKFPIIEKHLKRFYSELKPRKRKETVGRKPGDYKWFEIQDNTAYYSEFEKPEKIIWGLTADKWAYAYDDGRHYLPSNGYILTSKKIPIKYLLGLLNSNLLKFYFGFIGIMTAGGAFTLKYATVAQFPIVVTDDPQPIIAIVDTILSAKKENPAADTSALERKIDALVYELYGLTKEEVVIVEKE